MHLKCKSGVLLDAFHHIHLSCSLALRLTPHLHSCKSDLDKLMLIMVTEMHRLELHEKLHLPP